MTIDQLPFTQVVDNTNCSIPEKIALFGPSAIPLIFPQGSKGSPVPNPKDPSDARARSVWNKYCAAWTKRTLADTQRPEYQADLANSRPKNIGIRQGGGFTDLCAFDFDTEDCLIWEEFFKCNPVKNAVISIGRRGFTIWFKILGPYPKATTVWSRGKKGETGFEAVEWRSELHSIIHGVHPSGMDYQLWVIGEGLSTCPWSDFTCPSAAWPWARLFSGETNTHRARASTPRDPLPETTLKRRVAIVNSTYSVIEWDPDFSKARVRCKEEDKHGSPTREEDCIVFTGADEMGAVAYHCSHTHACVQGGLNDTETRWLINRFIEEENIFISDDIIETQKERALFFARIKASNAFFKRGTSYPFSIIHWRPDMPAPIPLSPNTFATRVATENIRYVKILKKGNKKPCRPPDHEIRETLEDDHWDCPVAKSFVRHPLLVKDEANGEARIVANQYFKPLEIIVLPSKITPQELETDFESALKLINSLLDHFTFKDKINRARAWAQLLTPALLQGGFIKRPIPSFLLQSDLPAAGKNLLIVGQGEIYQEQVIPHAYASGGIGAIDEIIRNTVYRGEASLFIDELSGPIKSPLLNALITTEEETDVRVAFERFIRASVAHLIVFLAGVKGFVLEAQLATRVLPIQILKDTYKLADDGSELKDWISANSVRLLGAIYAVILEWVKRGAHNCPRDSRFSSWSMVVNAILEKILGLPKATENLENIQGEIANEALSWIEKVLSEISELGLCWSPEDKNAFVLRPIHFAQIVDASGLGFPSERLNNAKPQQQASFISKEFLKLKPVARGERITVMSAGDYFVSCYSCGKDSHKNEIRKFLVSRNSELPSNIIDYSPSDDVASMMQ
jgi:hypothetical protein